MDFTVTITEVEKDVNTEEPAVLSVEVGSEEVLVKTSVLLPESEYFKLMAAISAWRTATSELHTNSGAF